MNTIPNTINTQETGRNNPMSSGRMFSDRLKIAPKSKGQMIKAIKNTIPVGGKEFGSPGNANNAFTVTTTSIDTNLPNKDVEIRLDTQRLELDITKEEESKNYRLKLELSNLNDESLTFDDISHLRSPTMGKKVMIEYSKKTK